MGVNFPNLTTIPLTTRRPNIQDHIRRYRHARHPRKTEFALRGGRRSPGGSNGPHVERFGGTSMCPPPTIPRPKPTNRHRKRPPTYPNDCPVSRVRAKLFEWLHKVHRRRLESDEPDATGAWEPKHRRSVLRYVHDRDGGRCGLCGAKMKIKGAHVEHIAPKILPTFNINGVKAVSGNQFKSVLHKLDNLQAAHSYCNKPKGNSPDMGRWRHPDMPPLVIAISHHRCRVKVDDLGSGGRGLFGRWTHSHQ